jgi:hypothetical protein
LLRASQSGDFSNRAAFLGRGLQMNNPKADGSLSERRAVPKSIVDIAGKSGLLGMFDYVDPVTRELTCRQTNFTVKKFSTFRDTIPLMHRVDAIFQLVCPEEYKRQMTEVLKIHPRSEWGSCAGPP